MVVIVLVVPSPSNGHNSDKNSETIHHQYDINNNNNNATPAATTWSLKNEIAQTYNYAARDYRKMSNNGLVGNGGGLTTGVKENNRHFVRNSSGRKFNKYHKNAFVKSDVCNNDNNNRNKLNNATTKNYERFITRITISDDFSQTEIGSDQLAEAVTKEGEFFVTFFNNLN